MKKVKSILIVVFIFAVLILSGGCSQEKKEVQYTFKNQAGYNIYLNMGNTSQTIKPGDVVKVLSKEDSYRYSSSREVSITQIGNTIIFSTKTDSNSITVTNRVDLNMSGNPSGLSFGIHHMTWGIPEGLASDVWFTPDTQYEPNFTNPSTGSHYIPTLKTGNSCIRSGIVNDEYGRYLYFVLTGDTELEYWRTTDVIKIGNNVGKNKSYVIYANSETVQTDENGIDSPSPARVIVAEVTNEGKRSTQKEIPVTRIK